MEQPRGWLRRPQPPQTVHHTARNAAAPVRLAPATAATGGGGSLPRVHGRQPRTAPRHVGLSAQHLHDLRLRAAGSAAAGSAPPRPPHPPPQRPPRLPPLPYWCEAVAVVGLPRGELVFRFQTPAQASATARREHHPEAAHGGAAVRLASLPGERVQQLLDRWQYASAQQELARLVAAPLWGCYEPPADAGPAAAAEPALGRAAPETAAAQRSPGEGGRRQLSADQRNRQQMRQLLQRVAPRNAAGARGSGGGELQESGGGSSASGAAPRLAPFSAAWDACVIRGQPDGTLVFSFAAGRELQASAGGDGARGGLTSRRRRRQLLLESPGVLEGVPFSTALLLDIKSAAHAQEAHRRLQQVAGEWPSLPVRAASAGRRGGSRLLFPSYAKAAARLARHQQRLGTRQARGKGRQALEKGGKESETGHRQGCTDGQQRRREPGPQAQPGGAVDAAAAAWPEAPTDSGAAAPAGGAPSTAPPRRLSALLAGAGAAAAAAGRLGRLLASVLTDAWLSLYRRLPVALRSRLWRTWPPQVDEPHVSPTLAALMRHHDQRLTLQQLAAAGFDAQGQTSAPLADLPRWRLERLTLCGVRDVAPYRAALTHKSALPLQLRTQQSYERLEFLGDAVLGLCTRALLLRARPGADEGRLSELNSQLVSGSSNARYAAYLGLERYVLPDPRSFRAAEQHSPALLADVFEALLGALYVDRGFEAARGFCERVLAACVEWGPLEAARDQKALLSRHALAEGKPAPVFFVQGTSKREFKAGLQLTWWTVAVRFQGVVMGTGSAFDKRGAEQAAARDALQRLGVAEPEP